MDTTARRAPESRQIIKRCYEQSQAVAAKAADLIMDRRNLPLLKSSLLPGKPPLIPIKLYGPYVTPALAAMTLQKALGYPVFPFGWIHERFGRVEASPAGALVLVPHPDHVRDFQRGPLQGKLTGKRFTNGIEAITFLTDQILDPVGADITAALCVSANAMRALVGSVPTSGSFNTTIEGLEWPVSVVSVSGDIGLIGLFSEADIGLDGDSRRPATDGPNKDDQPFEWGQWEVQKDDWKAIVWQALGNARTGVYRSITEPAPGLWAGGEAKDAAALMEEALTANGGQFAVLAEAEAWWRWYHANTAECGPRFCAAASTALGATTDDAVKLRDRFAQIADILADHGVALRVEPIGDGSVSFKLTFDPK